MLSEVSGSLVVRDKSLLMVFSEEEQTWDVPSTVRFSNEISADAAERAAKELTGCDSHVLKYKKKLKTSFTAEGEEHKWQPYSVKIEGEPQNGEWVPISELGSRDLSAPLESVKSKLTSRL